MSGDRFNNMLAFDIEPHDDGFYARTDICGRITRTFINVRAAAQEKAIREKLIELGWTPPPDTLARATGDGGKGDSNA